MNIDELLARLRSLKVNLQLEGDELSVSAPKGVLDDVLRSELVSNKAEIISVLRSIKMAVPVTTHYIERLQAQENYPLTHSQERLWLVTRIVEDTSIYNLFSVFRLTGQLNTDALEQSLNEIVARHGSLRTTFTAVNGQPCQRVAQQLTNYLTRVDLRHLQDLEKDQELQKCIRDDMLQGFDLELGPLLRTTLFWLDKDDYVLLINMHHIISDGWSMGIFFRELGDLYDKCCRGQSATLPALSIQYTDYAVWERKWLADKVLEDQLNYWRVQLQDLPTLQLPQDHPRPPIQTYRGEIVDLTLPLDVSKKLEVLSQEQGGTLFMTLLSAFTILLHKYCGQDDIVVGTPVANRKTTELETLIGFFVNMLVLRTDVSGDPTFTELMEKTKVVTLGAYDHQEVPFEKLVEELQPERDLSRNPLFQVIFALQNTPITSLKFAGVTLSGVSKKIETTRFDFEAHVQQIEDGLSIRFVYNPDLFEESTVSQMLNHYAQILKEVSATPDKRLSQLTMLSEQEKRLLLVEMNQTETEYARNLNVVALFEAQAVAAPDAVAVNDGGSELTYWQLNEQANRLAHYLKTHGAGADVLVGVCLERSMEMVIAQLAILKAGCAYIPIDPEYPPHRQAFILEDTQAPVLLTQSSLLPRIPGYTGIAFCLDTDRQKLDEQGEHNPDVQIQTEDLCYVIYTSGSTGKPKGVEVTHAGLMNLVSWHIGAYQVTAADRSTHLAGLGFDASVWELWPYLSAGASIYLVPEEERYSPPRLWEWMALRGITLSFLPTPLAEAALKEHLPENLKLRVLLTGGDRLHGGLVAGELPFRVVNHYGPTENTVVATCADVDFMSGQEPSIGNPVDNVQIYILDQQLQLVPMGVPGELYIGGDSLARGYLNRVDLTAEKFVANPFATKHDSRLYRTGDTARYRADGSIEFIGRVDHQVKLRGFRIELGEIEAALNHQPGIESTVVQVREDETGDKQLVAYIVPSAGLSVNVDEIRSELIEILPAYMVPSAFVILNELPLTQNGKVDIEALPAPDVERQTEEEYTAPRSEVESDIAEIWKQVLKLEQIGMHDNFFSLGGNSLLLAQVHEKVQQVLNNKFSIIDLFKYPSISTLASHLTNEKPIMANNSHEHVQQRRHLAAQGNTQQSESIAIIGMTGRFPGAGDIESFWNNLHDGVESITFFSEEELKQAGIPNSLLNDPDYVRASVQLDDVDMFDAAFFGYSPRQAQAIDPQQRFFLECAWEVMERAAYVPDQYQGRVGVYGGVSTNNYLSSLIDSQALTASFNDLDIRMGNDKDFLTTRVSYNLSLTGPGITLQTACSTSLVATHLAIQGLKARDCDMAIAGGSCIRNYQAMGYRYQEGGISSPDGHCRAFDAHAKGTISGDGTTAVLLKRLDDALADGDQIYAVIKGSAINNDGSQKIGYTAPGVQGQAEVVTAAQTQAGFEPRSISYIETHGTGTPLGDPIEIEALTQVFQRQTQDKNFCAIGSVKTNLGHLDSAAGVAGLIKTALSLWHKELPPSLHYHSPNPQIDFENNPFFVNAKLTPWRTGTTLRRAGVSSFGIGGTNAHVVLEEAPSLESSSPARPWQLLTLSAKTATALETMTHNLYRYLQSKPQVNLADLAYTLQIGRKTFDFRRAVICRDVEDAIEALESRNPRRITDSVVQDTDRPVVFMFTGQGAQYPNMGLQLYQNQPYYRELVDQCCETLHEHLGLDLRGVLFPSEAELTQAKTRLNQTEITQCSLFVTEYALAKLWMSWGVSPAAMIGHSIGEYTAACLSGVMSLEDCLRLVATRGGLMGGLPEGSMLAVSLSEAEIAPLLTQNIEIATINSPQMCAVSGPDEAIESFAFQLDQKGIQAQKLHTSHAFHSFMMEPVLDDFTDFVSKLSLHSAQIPYISNVTGTWITDKDATSAQYYSSHLRHTVRFSEGLSQLFSEPDYLFLEVGPGHTLSSLAKHHPDRQAGQSIISSIRHVNEELSDDEFIWQAIGKLWLAGGRLDWASMYNLDIRHRILLPTYPFERQRYWVDSIDTSHVLSAHQVSTLLKIKDSAKWCYLPIWKSSFLQDKSVGDGKDYTGRWLIFQDENGLIQPLAERIVELGGEVVLVKAGEQFNKLETRLFELNPACREDYQLLIDETEIFDISPDRIIHAFGLVHDETPDLSETLDLSFYSMLYLSQVIDKRWPAQQLHIDVITNNVQAVTGNEKLYPEKSFILGLCKVLPIEMPGISCRNIDLELSDPVAQLDPFILAGLLGELGEVNAEANLAYRFNRRWILDYENTRPESVNKKTDRTPRLRERGVYLITGGIGGVGLAMAEYLAKTVSARLILTARTELPLQSSWDEWLASHDDRDMTSAKILKLRALEAMGAELMLAAVDVADSVQMKSLLEKAQDKYGAIHGVIHAAGVVSGPSLNIIQNLNREKCEFQFKPKVYGLLVLKELFENQPLDFIMPVSSLSTVLGGLGFAAYASANQFMDSFTQQQYWRGNTNWISVDWEGWDFDEKDRQDVVTGSTESLALKPEEGVLTFDRVLRQGKLPQVIISTADLRYRIEQWNSHESRQEEENTAVEIHLEHPRPVLSSDYVKPGNDVERTLTEIWQNALGIDHLGINDNFFELGGDSVLNIQITALAKKQGLMLTPGDVFECHTIAELAALASVNDAMKQEDNACQKDADQVTKENVISEADLAEILRQQEKL